METYYSGYDNSLPGALVFKYSGGESLWFFVHVYFLSVMFHEYFLSVCTNRNKLLVILCNF